MIITGDKKDETARKNLMPNTGVTIYSTPSTDTHCKVLKNDKVSL